MSTKLEAWFFRAVLKMSTKREAWFFRAALTVGTKREAEVTNGVADWGLAWLMCEHGTTYHHTVSGL